MTCPSPTIRRAPSNAAAVDAAGMSSAGPEQAATSRQRDEKIAFKVTGRSGVLIVCIAASGNVIEAIVRVYHRRLACGEGGCKAACQA
jgi:hypothetical protein